MSLSHKCNYQYYAKVSGLIFLIFLYGQMELTAIIPRLRGKQDASLHRMTLTSFVDFSPKMQ